MKWLRTIVSAGIYLCSFTAAAQIPQEKIQEFLSDEYRISDVSLHQPALVKILYQNNNFNAVWLNDASQKNIHTLFRELEACDDVGLDKKDYQFNFIQAFIAPGSKLNTAADSLLAELRFSDAAVHFYNDAAYGNLKPAFGCKGLKYTPNCYNIPLLLLQHITTNRLPDFRKSIRATLPEITVMERELRRMNEVLRTHDFSETNITSNNINSSNKSLLIKLIQLGLLTDAKAIYSDSILKEKVKEAQYCFNITADGIAGKHTLRELNVPLTVRKRQLIFSLNYYRWLSCLTQKQRVIVVNIPAAFMKVYSKQLVLLEMKMVVGKKSTPTYTLTSTVNEVILYPYWHVPYSIAVKELLPVIKRNPGFINAGNYQVLNNRGQIMDSYAINWKALGSGNFPYLLRQSTGCDNALGLLKLNFYNPFGAYLHDTNSKNLFKMQKRFFSHGCMRMEKPMELGRLILKNNHIAIDTLEQKGCLRNHAPVIVHADEHMPVIIWYNPAGIDVSGRLIFFEDVYGIFNWND
jgi:L,D-transpeptidase YcbB